MLLYEIFASETVLVMLGLKGTQMSLFDLFNNSNRKSVVFLAYMQIFGEKSAMGDQKTPTYTGS